MASTLVKIHGHTIYYTNLTASRLQKSSISSLQLPPPHHSYITFSSPRSRRKLNFPVLSLQSSRSSSSSNPPSSKEEAILQAKTCLSTTLEKPLNNPKVVGRLKKLKQPRFRVEIPVIDDSPESLTQLASDVFQELPIRRKSGHVRFLLVWPNSEVARKAIGSLPSSQLQHTEMASQADDDAKFSSSIDVVVVLAPESSQLVAIKAFTDRLYPKPVVLFNPKWGFEEEEDFGEMRNFLGSFEVIYSFMGLEVKGILSRRKGVVFKCVRDGVLSGERWAVLVEEEGNLKVISRFKSRPSIGEVENVLYNLMAINSPITKSAKFLRDLVSNVTGKK